MNVNIKHKELGNSSITEIFFKLVDLKTEKDYDDLFQIASASASQYCFEASGLLSYEYDVFIKSLKPRISYVIQVGIDANNDKFFAFGQKSPSVDNKLL
jgi:hypothetical protein